jgi:sulfur-oxidizing protein SoxB
VWDLVADFLRAKKVVKPVTVNRPQLTGVEGNPGLS